MKNLILLVVLCLGVAHGSEVARVLHHTVPVSVFRNFEQIYLSKNSRVMGRDLLSIEGGIVELSSGESMLQVEGPSKLQLQRQNRHVEVSLLSGRVLLDCRKGEGWNLKYGPFDLKGEGGLFHASVENDGLELVRLEGSSLEIYYNGSLSTRLKVNEAGRLVPSSSRVKFLRNVTEFEAQAYRDSLIGSVVLAGEMPLDLEGRPFVPLQKMREREMKRRKALAKAQGIKNAKGVVTSHTLGRLDRESEKNLEEAMDETSSFSFPLPPTPIPSP